jgi:uncharacterized protein YjbJ (UPF0337 family)
MQQQKSCCCVLQPRLSMGMSQPIEKETFGWLVRKIQGGSMNKDILEGKWKQIRGEAKAWWGKLSDNDLDRAAGKFDVLVGVLQEKYGYTRQQAADEVNKRVTDYEASLKKNGPVS